MILGHFHESKSNFIQFYHKRCKSKAALWSVNGFRCQLFFLRHNKVALRTAVMMVLLVSSCGLKQHEDTRKLGGFARLNSQNPPADVTGGCSADGSHPGLEK